MSSARLALFVAVVFCSIPMSSHAQSGNSPRQYYSTWQKHPQHGYHYRTYYYKPTPKYVGYKHHYVIHHPSKPKHVYYYNPYKKVYWGRCDATGNGEPRYSLLAEADRKPILSSIAESAFPEPSSLPALPDATDGVLLDLPPDDLPEALAPAAER